MDSRSDKKRRKKKFKTLVRNIVHQLHTLGNAGQKYTIKNIWTLMLMILRWQPEKKKTKKVKSQRYITHSLNSKLQHEVLA